MIYFKIEINELNMTMDKTNVVCSLEMTKKGKKKYTVAFILFT